MEQAVNQENIASGTTFSGAKKKNTGLTIGMAICAVLAIGGISFGVFEMTQVSQVKSQIADLKVEVKKGDGTTTTVEKPEVKTTTENKTTVTIKEAPVKVENADEYIWVGAWGIKIKIPDSLKTVSYTFNNSSDGSLCVNGVKYLEGGMHYVPEFAMFGGERTGLACVSKNSEIGTEVIFNNQKYSVAGSHFVYSKNKNESDWEVKSRDLIIEMLSNASNYSKM